MILLLLSKCLLKTQVLLNNPPLYPQDPEPTDTSCFENSQFLPPPSLSALPKLVQSSLSYPLKTKNTCPCSSQNYPKNINLKKSLAYQALHGSSPANTISTPTALLPTQAALHELSAPYSLVVYWLFLLSGSSVSTFCYMALSLNSFWCLHSNVMT